MTAGSAYALLTLAALFWSGNWIAGRALAELVPPAGLTFWRWVIALALIFPIVAPRLWRSRALLAAHWRAIVVLGVLGGGLHNVLQYWGLQYTSATNGVILNSLTPIFILIMGAGLLREAFSRQAALGAAIAFTGTLAIITVLDVGVLLALRFNPGDLLIMLSHVMLAGYTLCLRWRPPGLDALSFVACFAGVALVPVGALHLLELANGARVILTPASIAGLAYVSVFPALLAYHFWNLGVSVIGAARAGVFLYLMPLFGSLLAIALLGERFGVHHAVGVALIIAGVFMATRRG